MREKKRPGKLHNPVLANGTGMVLSTNVHGFNLAGAELHAIHFADVAVARASLGTDPLNTVQKLVQEAAASLPHHALAKEYSGLSEAMRERVQPDFSKPAKSGLFYVRPGIVTDLAVTQFNQFLTGDGFILSRGT